MGTLNRVTLIGYLGADVELRYTQTGTAVANFRMATSETWRDTHGHRQQRTEWHRIVVWGSVAETCNEYLRKGRSVCVEGKLQARNWMDSNGQAQKTTEIVAHQVTFLSSASATSHREAASFNPLPAVEESAAD